MSLNRNKTPLFSARVILGSIKSMFFLFGAVLGLSIWVFDPVVDAVFMKEGTVYQQLTQPSSIELYFRLIVSVLIIFFSFICSLFLYRARRAESEIKIVNEQLNTIIDSEPECVKTVAKDGTLLSMNPAGLAMVEAESFDEVEGVSVYDLIAPEYRDNFIELNRRVFEGESVEQEYEITGLKGGRKFVETHAAPLFDNSGNIIAHLAVTRDITERKHADRMLTYHASHDTLTGLVNRYEFERRVERLISAVQQDNGEHALCFMDLDQFKVVNDTCGHIAGDEMLRQLGSLIQNTVRHRDTLARLGGDEFGVLIEHCQIEDACRIATSIQKAIQGFQFPWEGQYFKVGVSIGLAPITKTTPNLTELLKNADAACYMAKDKGRNRIHVYHTEDSEIAKRHDEMQRVAQINKALEEDRLCLFAQIIEPLDNHQGNYYELLLRLKDDAGKIMTPDSFLPAAERYNLITKLDCWVIEHAFNMVAEHPLFIKEFKIYSINISGQSLTDPEFLDFVISRLEGSGIRGERICFEITETAAISNLNAAEKFILKLKESGCQFALDDFGSGLSSFGYLKTLPVDYLKIDGMFVKDIVKDPIDRAMVKSINDIGQVMGMQTIAEFVENDEIKGMLREIGVNFAQGYGIGRPVPLDVLLGKVDNVTDIRDVKKSDSI